MPSPGVTPARRPDDVPPEGPTSSGLDRVITVLSSWWMATPLILLAPAIAFATGFPDVREELGMVFGVAGLGSAVITPTVGFVVALVGRRPKARSRFIIMGTVSSVPVFFFWLLSGPLAECPDGYHC